MSRGDIAYHPSVPLHHQIQQLLRSRIEAGDLEPDEQIPTEFSLARRFQVSRATIRVALHSLERDGLIVRRQGRGTFVRHSGTMSSTKTRITHLLLGYEAEVRVVRAETIPAPAHVVSFLGMARGERIKRFVRVEMVDDAPLAAVLNYVPMELGSRITTRALRRYSMLEFLRDRLRIEFGDMRQIIEARLPDDELASLLGITLTQPVLFLRLLVSDRSGKPVQISDTFYRGDRYRHEVDAPALLPGSRTGARPGGPARDRKGGRGA
jgi:GntR family transcriptional regulator